MRHLAPVLLIACVAPQDEGMVLLDAEALDAGWSVEIDGEVHADALPRRAHVDATVDLVDPIGDVEPIEPEPGVLTWLRGTHADPDWAVIGEDITPHRVQLVGLESSAEKIAERLDADAVFAVERHTLTGPDVLWDLADADAEDLYEVLPVDADDYTGPDYAQRGSRSSGLFGRTSTYKLGAGTAPTRPMPDARGDSGATVGVASVAADGATHAVVFDPAEDALIAAGLVGMYQTDDFSRDILADGELHAEGGRLVLDANGTMTVNNGIVAARTEWHVQGGDLYFGTQLQGFDEAGIVMGGTLYARVEWTP